MVRGRQLVRWARALLAPPVAIALLFAPMAGAQAGLVTIVSATSRIVATTTYLAFILIMTGFLLQWPTLVTLAMFPVLVWVYARLARREEAAARAEFGPAWDSHARSVPGFIPGLGRGSSTTLPPQGGTAHG